MNRIESFDEYRALVDVVKMHDYRYFGLNNPTISDEEYDAMYFALQEYEEQHTDEILPDSPTQQCYSENGNGKRTAHHGKAWHQVRASGWATKNENDNENENENIHPNLL